MPTQNRYDLWELLRTAQAECDHAYQYGHINGSCGRVGGMGDRGVTEPRDMMDDGAYGCERARRHTGPHMWRGNNETYPFWGRGYDNIDPIVDRARIRDFTRTMMQPGDTLNLSCLINGEPTTFRGCRVMEVQPSRFSFRIATGSVGSRTNLWCRRQDLIEMNPITTQQYPEGIR